MPHSFDSISCLNWLNLIILTCAFHLPHIVDKKYKCAGDKLSSALSLLGQNGVNWFEYMQLKEEWQCHSKTFQVIFHYLKFKCLAKKYTLHAMKDEISHWIKNISCKCEYLNKAFTNQKREEKYLMSKINVICKFLHVKIKHCMQTNKVK